VDIRRVILDPLTFTPDALEYDDGGPQLVLLNQKIAADIKRLSSRGDGFPAIVDRSPNDRYWVIEYSHREGTPRMALYDRRAKTTAPLPAAAFTAIESRDWRVRPFALPGTNGAKVTGYVSLPRAGVCEAQRCPAVLRIHGGPGERDYAKFDYERF
jgi:dipeptidyl aminopeptidase/acylaminoacyl peptidase